MRSAPVVQNSRSVVHAPHAMVATSQPLATSAALAVLRDGGSAVDAALCANAVLGVVEPTGCGIGGDLMAIVHDPKERAVVGFNGSGRSPLALTRAVLEERGVTAIPARGGLAVSVPGCVDGWCALHERFGVLPLARVLEPAIGYAREGFPLSPVIAHEWAAGLANLKQYQSFTDQFAQDGKAPLPGRTFVRRGLADVLQRIAEQGRAAFYEGDVARAIERAVGADGGLLSMRDLADHAGEWVEPLCVTYRDLKVYELPGNTQGPTALEMLALLEHFDVASLDFQSADHVHLFTEIKKLAFADRARFIGDSSHPTSSGSAGDGSIVLDPGYVAERARLVSMERAAVEVPSGAPLVAQGDTVTLAVGDAGGQMVSLIQSNFRGFGSGIAPSGLGFVLQNRGELFDLSPGAGANAYAPGKRPFHTIIPGFAKRGGESYLAFGVMGGDTQPQAHAQVLSNLVDFGLDLQAAGDVPRWVHLGEASPTDTPAGGGIEGVGELVLETGIDAEVARGLEARGHRVRADAQRRSGHFGGYQAVARSSTTESSKRVYSGGSDVRKDGNAAGF
ncbi:gamma-glutamyltransferase family protein [Planctomycetes bacterium Pla163]